MTPPECFDPPECFLGGWAEEALGPAQTLGWGASPGTAADRTSVRCGDDRPSPRHTPGHHALGVDVGELATGPLNTITDVPGVTVGHVTVLVRGSRRPLGRDGDPPTSLEGVFHRPPAAGVAVLNGVGELTGALSIAELGFLGPRRSS